MTLITIHEPYWQNMILLHVHANKPNGLHTFIILLLPPPPSIVLEIIINFLLSIFGVKISVTSKNLDYTKQLIIYHVPGIHRHGEVLSAGVMSNSVTSVHHHKYQYSTIYTILVKVL